MKLRLNPYFWIYGFKGLPAGDGHQGAAHGAPAAAQSPNGLLSSAGVGSAATRAATSAWRSRARRDGLRGRLGVRRR